MRGGTTFPPYFMQLFYEILPEYALLPGSNAVLCNKKDKLLQQRRININLPAYLWSSIDQFYAGTKKNKHDLNCQTGIQSKRK